MDDEVGGGCVLANGGGGAGEGWGRERAAGEVERFCGVGCEPMVVVVWKGG